MIKNTVHRILNRRCYPSTSKPFIQRNLTPSSTEPVPRDRSILQTTQREVDQRPTDHHQPGLIDLEKLKPTRLSEYLPTHHPNWYIDQIQSISNRLNRAFSKPQLIQIIRSIQGQQRIDDHLPIVQATQSTTPKLKLDRSTSKKDLISFILFDHWHLTNPKGIPTDQSFHDLVQRFKQDHQSHQLPYHELFLLYLDQLQAQRFKRTSALDQLAGTTNVTIELGVDQQQLTIHGGMKDREKFWKSFKLNRRPIYQTRIYLDRKDSSFKPFHQLGRESLTSVLKELSELSGCYLEIALDEDREAPNELFANQKKILVAYSFDRNNLAERVLKVIQRFSIPLTEFDHVPILIDLNRPSQSVTTIGSNQESLSESTMALESLAFLPFSYPFTLKWPFHLIFNSSNLARLSSPVIPSPHETEHDPSISTRLEAPIPFDRQHTPEDVYRILASRFKVLTGLSSDSITPQSWISDCVEGFEKYQTSHEWTECQVYQGHYVKSKNPCGELVEKLSRFDSLTTHSDQDQVRPINLSKDVYSSKVGIRHQPGKFVFLPASTNHPIDLAHDLKPSGDVVQRASQEVHENEQQFSASPPDLEATNDQLDGVLQENEPLEDLSVEVYVPLHKKSETDDHHILANHGSSAMFYELIEVRLPHLRKTAEVHKVWRKRIVVLRPHQSTDLMIQVERRSKVSNAVELVELDNKSELMSREIDVATAEEAGALKGLVTPQEKIGREEGPSSEIDRIKQLMMAAQVNELDEVESDVGQLLMVDRFTSRRVMTPDRSSSQPMMDDHHRTPVIVTQTIRQKFNLSRPWSDDPQSDYDQPSELIRSRYIRCRL